MQITSVVVFVALVAGIAANPLTNDPSGLPTEGGKEIEAMTSELCGAPGGLAGELGQRPSKTISQPSTANRRRAFMEGERFGEQAMKNAFIKGVLFGELEETERLASDRLREIEELEGYRGHRYHGHHHGHHRRHGHHHHGHHGRLGHFRHHHRGGIHRRL
ncbi:hypothetical protein DACRYDRAFT_24144, partial [Dacryopinax primogenitus]